MKFFALLPELDAALPVAAQPLETFIPGSADVRLESFGPALPGDPEFDPACPIESHREVIEFEHVPMGTAWGELSADENALARLRVGSMADVSGRAWYTLKFDLPEGIRAIEIAARHNERDFLVGGTINGTALPSFNCMDDRLLVTEGLKAGQNTLTLNLDSILTNRLNYESPGYLAKADLSLMSFGGGSREYSIRHRHGVESVTITPYV